MKNIALVLVCTLFLCLSCKKDIPEPPDVTINPSLPPRPPFILAGDSMSTTLSFFPFSPVLSYTMNVYSAPVNNPVDMNNDGMRDFTIRETGSHALGGMSIWQESDIVTDGGWEVAKDTGNPQYVKSFQQGDTIAADNQWFPLNSAARIAYSYWSGGPNGSSSGFVINHPYLGLRKQTTTDTLYGWLKVSIGSSSGLMVTNLHGAAVLR